MLKDTPKHLIPGASLGLVAANASDLIRQVEQGLPFTTLQTFASNAGVPVFEITSIIGIPKRTLARRKPVARLKPSESERLLRISIVFDKAVRLFEGDIAAAVTWLKAPRRVLNNHSPLSYCRTELGAKEVESLIGRLEHGIF